MILTSGELMLLCRSCAAYRPVREDASWFRCDDCNAVLGYVGANDDDDLLAAGRLPPHPDDEGRRWYENGWRACSAYVRIAHGIEVEYQPAEHLDDVVPHQHVWVEGSHDQMPYCRICNAEPENPNYRIPVEKCACGGGMLGCEGYEHSLERCGPPRA